MVVALVESETPGKPGPVATVALWLFACSLGFIKEPNLKRFCGNTKGQIPDDKVPNQGFIGVAP